MSCTTHPDHEHVHGEGCGHTAVRHDDHADYLHDAHLHFAHEGHYDEHVVAIDGANPADCRPVEEHDHAHGSDCGHEPVPHGDHVDYLVEGRLHHPHGAHCDDHGVLELA